MVRRGRLGALILLMASLLLGLLAPPAALAQQASKDVFFASDFRSGTAAPGSQLSLRMQVRNRTDAPVDVEMRVAEAPEGWNVVFWEDFRKIKLSQLRVVPGDFVSFELRIDIPQDAALGDYRIVSTLHNSEGVQIDRVEHIITVEPGAARRDEAEVIVRQPSIIAPSNSTLSYSMQVRNGTEEERVFSLGAQAPQGWQVTFKPGFEDKVISSISVPAAGLQSITMEVRPAPTAPAGEHTILVAANAGTIEARTEVKAILTGRPELAVGTGNERLDVKAVAGRPNSVTLIVANRGTGDLENVQLVMTPPSGWRVELEPTRIDRLEAGTVQQVTASITPGEKAIPGDYMVSFIARSDRSQERIDLRVTVLQSTIWGWLGVVVVFLVSLGLVGLFFRFGRR